MQRSRRIGWLALVAVLALVAAGCEDGPGDSTAESDEDPVAVETTGKSGPPRQPIEVVAAAATTAEDAGSSAFELTGTSTVAGVSTDVNAEGAFDYTTGNLEMTISTDVSGTGSLEIEELFVDGVAYVKIGGVPGLGAIPGIGDKWISLDLGELDVPGGAGETLGVQTSPTDQLAALRAAGDVEEVGTEDVRGETATHYTATIDLGTYIDEGLDAAGHSLTTEEIEELTGLVNQLGGETQVDVWINDDGLPVRYTAATSAEIEGEGAVESDITMEFFDFGVDVSPEPPPADETTDFNELLGGLGGGLGGDIVQVPEGVPGGGGGT